MEFGSHVWDSASSPMHHEEGAITMKSEGVENETYHVTLYAFWSKLDKLETKWNTFQFKTDVFQTSYSLVIYFQCRKFVTYFLERL